MASELSPAPVWPRRVVSITVLIEGLVITGYGLYLAVGTVVAQATERLAAAVLSVLVIALGVGLAALARAVARARRWARAPVLVWQVLQASVAVPALTTRWPIGLALLLLCLVAGGGVLRSDVLPDPPVPT